MDCAEFLDNYSDYLDRRLEVCSLQGYQEHLQECPSCLEYDRVMNRGLELIRQLEPPERAPDFSPRLHTRIRELQQRLQSRASTWNRAATGALMGATLLFLAVSLPVIGAAGSAVELPPVVVDRPGDPGLPVSLWGRTPALQPAPSLLLAPDFTREPLLALPTERLSLFRAPLRPAVSQPIGDASLESDPGAEGE